MRKGIRMNKIIRNATMFIVILLCSTVVLSDTVEVSHPFNEPLIVEFTIVDDVDDTLSFTSSGELTWLFTSRLVCVYTPDKEYLIATCWTATCINWVGWQRTSYECLFNCTDREGATGTRLYKIVKTRDNAAPKFVSLGS